MIFILLILSGAALPTDYTPPRAAIIEVHECVPYKELYTSFKQNGLSNRESRNSAFHASKGNCFR